jgi:flavorubredoxin
MSMTGVMLTKGVYWVGAVDWDLRFCGSYTTPHGTTYNAYLIVDEQVVLVDTVKTGFEREMLERIGEIVNPADIDYVICNHSEIDHSGAMPTLMQIARDAKVIASPAGKTGLYRHYGTDWNASVVKTGDELKIGGKSLMFIEAPMLHWPDNLFVHIREDRILMTNDAFGQHIATQKRFEDEIGPAIMDEAKKYFAVIVSPYSSLVQKKIAELEGMKIGIDIIAPAHGAIWRDPSKIVEAYKHWSSGDAESKVTIVYDTMWGSTGRMAREIARGIGSESVDVKVFNLRNSDISEIMKEMLDSRVIVVGSPTLNRDVYPTVSGFLSFLRGIRLQKKKAAVFGSYGWGGGATKIMTDELKKAGLEVLEESLIVQYVPTDEELKRCYEFGRAVARSARI